jgi:NAD(P)-dependent dehydrogenase (short-subunit alcohol dehydrogenase family)
MSAASLYQGQSTVELNIQAFRDSFETNVVGNLSLVQAFLAPEIPAIPFTSMDGKVKDTKVPQVPRPEKVILDVSTCSVHLTMPGQAAYGPSKLAFTRALAYLQRDVASMEGAPIRIHSFHPGGVLTPGARKALGDEEIEGFVYDDENLPGSFAVWLASPAAAFLKGRFVWSNWDVEEMTAMKYKFEEDPDFCTITLKM